MGQTVPDPTPVGEDDFSWIAVTAGHMHVCAIRDDGALWCWGSAGNGEHGTGATEHPRTPVHVAEGSCWRETALDMHGSCAIDEARTLQCFGRDITRRFAVYLNALQPCNEPANQNCLGTPSLSEATGPWRTAAISTFHGCGIRTDGSLWCWGGNGDTERPFGTPEEEVFPPMHIEVPGAEEPWSELSTFQNGTCVRDAGDRIWCTGRNRNGELGRITETHLGYDFAPADLPERL
jgi:alpha-tubulin suppressor-like RCC1 family protein